MMGRDPPSDIEIKVHPRRSDNAIHPVAGVGVEPSSSSNPHLYQEFRPFRRWFPWLIPSFVFANIVLFLITMYINDCPKNSVSCVAGFLGRFSFQPFKENPLLGPSASTLEKMGALEVSKVIHRHQAWRLITCIWLHAGVFHVLANMLSLLFIGIRLEQEFGFVRIGLLYVISGFGGSLLSALFIQSSISVGASGALFGLLGGMLSELITNWTIYENKVFIEWHLIEQGLTTELELSVFSYFCEDPLSLTVSGLYVQLAALLTLLFIVVINLAVGILPHVDNFAHIGGFVSGFLLGFVFLIRPQFGWVNQKSAPPGHAATSVKPKYKTYQYVLWVISLILIIVG
ncbi:hypothetical protein HHK36_018424 [Tetracentron sinense]|uniref:RHOMBOID-like protein n=1 Tax=Tetracentron sinense TaxID=13715 RepID=A0A834Z1H1_TETSI|nr:hypothetical protein HHK36_018424 [Tetracentron sinense]